MVVHLRIAQNTMITVDKLMHMSMLKNCINSTVNKATYSALTTLPQVSLISHVPFVMTVWYYIVFIYKHGSGLVVSDFDVNVI